MVSIVLVFTIVIQPNLVHQKNSRIHLVGYLLYWLCLILNLIIDTSQFAIACGADSTNSSMVSEYANVVSSSVFNTLFKFIVLIMPSAVLAFVSLNPP